MERARVAENPPELDRELLSHAAAEAVSRAEAEGEPLRALDAAVIRKHLFSLLDDPDIAERGLPGCVITEYKRCGRTRCRCRQGQLHGPYYYWNGRMLGLTWKHYLKRDDAPRVVALCQVRREKHVTREKLRAAMRVPRDFLCARKRPSSLNAFCTACSRTLQVLTKTRSASSALSVRPKPLRAKISLIRNVSCSFI